MELIRPKSRYAGMTVKVKESNADFEIEDWWENVYGKSWMLADGNPAALNYAYRIGTRLGEIPVDNEVLYGKVGPLGYLFHVSELELPEVT